MNLTLHINHLKIFLLSVLCLFASVAFAQDPFITEWITNTANESIIIPTYGGAGYNYSYTVDWGDGTVDTNIYTGDATHTFAEADSSHLVSITGDFPRIYFNDSTNTHKIRAINSWGDIEWESFEEAFSGCTNLLYLATDSVDLSNVTNMSYAFANTSNFQGNQTVNYWDVSNVTNMSHMFFNAKKFNADISSWNVSNVTNMDNMFEGATAFNQDISEWNTNLLTPAQDPFITEWITNTANESIIIPTYGGAGYNYSYTVDWGDGTVDTNIYTGDATHTFAEADSSHLVSITGDFPRIYFNDSTNTHKIRAINSWGDIEWESFEEAFSGCTNLLYLATDSVDLSNVTDMSYAFANTSNFQGNQTVNYWDVSNVTNMSHMFFNAKKFNADISSWNVSNVTNMDNMFEGATAFNQDISGWDLSNVISMENMFTDATSFNQDISDWELPNLTDMSNMFIGATSFNQDISDWDVSAVENMSGMFEGAASFNQDISGWDVSAVTNMSNMFIGATSFNQDISDWDVSAVENMSGMFEGAASFNQDISDWDVSNVEDMSYMFIGAIPAEQNLRGTGSSNNARRNNHVSRVAMTFDQDISNWDVSNVEDMSFMFYDLTNFDQDLSDWDISSVRDMSNMLDGTSMSIENYDNTLSGWNTLANDETKIPKNVDLDAAGLLYSYNNTARFELIDNHGWTISSDIVEFGCAFVVVEDMEVNSGVELVFPMFGCSEPEENNVVYTLDAESIEKGMSIDEQTGLFSWTPSYEDGGVNEVTLTVSNGNVTNSQQIIINVESVLEVVSQTEIQLVVYPNPAKGQYSVSLTDDYLGQIDIYVLDLSGKIVFKEEIYKEEAKVTYPLNIEGLNLGTYILEIKSNGTTKAGQRIIKM